ncbi:hypothetical protein WMF27_09540 [Sorangium sp. So ce281]|uniref:hypothetical protein n=1 Tax=unclassified Sorangium TaxID=2621164 RepID=UPI003F624D0E
MGEVVKAAVPDRLGMAFVRLDLVNMVDVVLIQEVVIILLLPIRLSALPQEMKMSFTLFLTAATSLMV